MSRFSRLCEISSPTGEERAIADAVKAELAALGLEVSEDDSAAAAGAGAGNLLARIPPAQGGEDGWVMFACHLDTVPHDGPIEVRLDEEGIYRSAGDTILGADNKAAVAVLIELAARYAEDPPPVGVELLFTVAEEQGLRGAAAFDQERLKAETAFVLDHAGAIGEVVTRAPGYMRLTADFTGVEAHAGLRPEDGRSAIVAAAEVIAGMELGRIDPETTANIGTVAGGSSSNVVAGHCRIEAEARSLDRARLLGQIATMTDRLAFAASESGCEVDIATETVFRGYEIPEGSRALAIAEAALAGCGHEVRHKSSGGGSDANVLIERGLDCLLLGNGTWLNHTADEWVSRDDLIAMLEVCQAIVETAAAC